MAQIKTKFIRNKELFGFGDDNPTCKALSIIQMKHDLMATDFYKSLLLKYKEMSVFWRKPAIFQHIIQQGRQSYYPDGLSIVRH